MKKKNGFTLIELLAIIVILAIIAVITVPIILNIIENSKMGAAQDSAYGYKDAIKKWYIGKLSTDPSYNIPDDTYSIDNLKELGVSLNGQEPAGNSWVAIEKNNLTEGCLQFDEYKVEINNGKVEKTQKGECKIKIEIPGEIIAGVKYYNTEWIKINQVYYNPGDINNNVAAGLCNIEETGCKIWYPYSEFTQNGQTYVNMIMDRNTSIDAAWSSKADYMGEGDNPASPSQNSTENSVGISYPNNQMTFESYSKYSNKNSKGPLTALKQLHIDTDSWNLPKRTDSYTPESNEYSNYTIDYRDYKARLITAEEIAVITKMNTASNPDAWGLSDVPFAFGSLSSALIYQYQTDEQQARQRSFSWLYDNTKYCASYGCENENFSNTQGYWTSSPGTSDPQYGFSVIFMGYLQRGTTSGAYGIRPVITIPKAALGIE